MAEEAPNNPSSANKDEGPPAIEPLQQESTEPTKEQQTKPPTDTDKNEDKPNEELEDIEIEENLAHQRQNDVSLNAITPLIQEEVEEAEDIDIQDTPQNNDEKEDDDTTQKQTVLRIDHGHCSMQGIRPTMEDQVVVESTLNVFGSKCTSGQLSLYGVFDGHGGSQCAEYCASRLISILSTYLLSEESV
eukprot:149501_1